jgi:hypothetical protein
VSLGPCDIGAEQRREQGGGTQCNKARGRHGYAPAAALALNLIRPSNL